MPIRSSSSRETWTAAARKSRRRLPGGRSAHGLAERVDDRVRARSRRRSCRRDPRCPRSLAGVGSALIPLIYSGFRLPPSLVTVSRDSHLFIGLVTHERSRFAERPPTTGLMARVADAAARAGATVTTAISDRDEYSEDAAPGLQLRSSGHRSAPSWRWSCGGGSTCRDSPREPASGLHGRSPRLPEAQLAPPWRRTCGRDDAGAAWCGAWSTSSCPTCA